MNKKHYTTPQMEAIAMKTNSLLLVSGNIGGGAVKPAMDPLFDELEDMYVTGFSDTPSTPL